MKEITNADIMERLTEVCVDTEKAAVGHLFDNIRAWGHDRGINNIDRQALKVFEEAGEMAREVVRDNAVSDKFVDAIGDILVSTIILADIAGYNAEDCLESAYNEIAPRTGKLLKGCFVKDSDLK